MSEVYVYVGTMACGCRVAVAVDRPEYAKRTGEMVAEMIGEGLTIHRELLTEFHKIGIHSCTHKATPVEQQLSIY